MSQWIDDDKSVYIREDLAYQMICYMNQGVIEANEFRKNLGVENDKPVRIEKEVITMIMKIFAKENLVSQYKIPGLPYLVDLCFVAHKLIIEIDKNGHPYYENDQIRQELIVELLLILTLMQVLIQMLKLQKCTVNESSVKLAVNSIEKSLKEKFPKELLSYISSISGPLEYIKDFIEKILPAL